MKSSSLFFIFFLFYASFARAETPVQVPLISTEDAEGLPENIQDATLFRRKPFISSYWDDPPAIRVCKSSGVTSARVDRAIRFWQRLGYRFAETIMDENSHVCSSGGVPGEITIMLVRSDIPMGDNMALTKTYYYTSTRKIIRAQIFMHSFSAGRERILEHEIGHALGWMHFNRSQHIMNRDYDRGGHNSYGVAYSEYVLQLQRIVEEVERAE